MQFETVIYELEDGLAKITLNRPERANTINSQLTADVTSALDEVQADPSVRIVVLTGAGRHFCGGADLRASREHTPDQRARPGVGGRNMFSRMEEISQPVIAAINGAAMGGGCELAIACDFRIMAEGARIGVPEIQFGALPAGGGTQRLPRIVGLAKAKEMIYTGKHYTAQEALSIGLVHQVVPDAELMNATYEFAALLKERAAYALAAAKWLVHKALATDLETGLQLERRVTSTMGSPEERAAARQQAALSQGTYANIFRGQA